MHKKMIVVKALVNAPIEKVWNAWILPEHIINWNFAADEWHSPSAQSDFKVGGSFVYRMEAKDGSMGFDFTGTFEVIKGNEFIEYSITGGRKVQVSFSAEGASTNVVESFEPEDENSEELQEMGWQAILNNFKKYVEGLI